MDSLNYERESQKEHVEIGRVYYQDSEKEQLFIATLELFGNGYDVTVYEDEEPQYVNRCVVRETSYEFLQYTDDGDKLIVRVNDDLFVMIEQQFELVKTYYDLLRSTPNAVNTFRPIKNTIGSVNNISAGHYFEEDDELFYVYEEILRDPGNIRLRMKLAYHLMNEIQYFERIQTVGDLVKYISLCKENLNEIINIKKGKDKRILFTKLVALSQLGCVYTLEGNLDEAVRVWYQALENAIESTIKENFHIKNYYLGVNALNIQCILNYFNEAKSMDNINMKYKNEITNFLTWSIEVIKKMADMEQHREFAQNQLIKLQNLDKLQNYFFIIEYSDDDFESIYCSNEDSQFDTYNFSHSRLMNIDKDLLNGVYKSIFEKDEPTINKQKMRIRAYL